MLTVGTTANAPLNNNWLYYPTAEYTYIYFAFYTIVILIGDLPLVKPCLLVIHAHTLYREATHISDLYTCYREVTPNCDS